MKAIRVHQFGEPEVMILEDVPDLTPDSREILIEVKAAGINPVDTYIRSGKYSLTPQLPYTPGFDAAGVIKAVGSSVKHYHAGDRVYVSGSLSGTYAQEVLCNAHQVYPLPDNVTFDQGAAIGVPYATAYRALFTKARAVANETVLIHGSSGGVGIAAIQLAKTANLKVIATAGSSKGLELVKRKGADFSLDHSLPGYMPQIMSMTQGRGVDIILEMLANVNLGDDLTVAAFNGRIVIIGSRGPASINPRDAMSRDLTICGMALLNVAADERARIYASLEEGLQNGQLKPVVARYFSLAEAPRAHQAVMEKGAYGKIILLP